MSIKNLLVQKQNEVDSVKSKAKGNNLLSIKFKT